MQSETQQPHGLQRESRSGLPSTLQKHPLPFRTSDTASKISIGLLQSTNCCNSLSCGSSCRTAACRASPPSDYGQHRLQIPASALISKVMALAISTPPTSHALPNHHLPINHAATKCRALSTLYGRNYKALSNTCTTVSTMPLLLSVPLEYCCMSDF